MSAEDGVGGLSDGGSGVVNAGFLIVGSGPAGVEAARAYRDGGGSGQVTMVTEDAHRPYQRPPLSKDYLRPSGSEADLDLEEESFYADRDIELVLGQRVVNVDASRRIASTTEGRELHYADCLLATGAGPLRPAVPGVSAAHVLRSRADAAALSTHAADASSAIVVGSGFIGCEAAASLAMRGLTVTLVSKEAAPQQRRLGSEVAARISSWLTALGVRLVHGALASISADARTIDVDDGERHSADVLLLAAGVQSDVGLAAAAGCRIEGRRVVTDQMMRTSAPKVWAAGDLALAYNGAAGRRIPVEHWGEALRMGEIAGANVAGADQVWAEVPGFWSEIGEHTVKYAAWGDGFDQVRFVDHDGGGFTAWYGMDGTVVGVLTSERDDDYETGRVMVEAKEPWRALG